MNTETNLYKILLIKVYFDKGMAILNYITKALMVVGIGAAVSNYSIQKIIALSGLYGLIGLFVGWAWFKYKLVDIETEILNQANPFCKDVREKI